MGFPDAGHFYELRARLRGYLSKQRLHYPYKLSAPQKDAWRLDILSGALHAPPATLMKRQTRKSTGASATGASIKVGQEWPDHFPSGCPGERGLPYSGRVFQFVRTVPPTGEDVTSALENGKHPKVCECTRAALSCYLDASYLREIQKSGGFWKSCKIAFCQILPEMGRIEQTGKSKHHSLWVRKCYLSDYLGNLEVDG